MKLVVIESPYAGNVELNLRYLREAMADCLFRGESPYASHGLYTQPGVLRDDVPAERARGIRAGFAWGEKADLVAVYEDLGVTPGMLAGIERATKRGQPVEHRRLGWDRPGNVLVVGPGLAARVPPHIAPGDEVELFVKEPPPLAVPVTSSPEVGDRGRIVRIVRYRVDGEPLEGDAFAESVAHVLFAGQERPIGFPVSWLRRVASKEPAP